VKKPPQTISLLDPGLVNRSSADQAQPPARPWIGIRFTCAGAYVRVYRNVQGTGYVAGCPKCGKQMRFRVGPGGTNNRFFDVSC
jgi:hypothetical protein